MASFNVDVRKHTAWICTYIQVRQITLLFVILNPSRNQTEINIPKIELKGHKILGAPANLHMPRLCEFCQILSRAPYAKQRGGKLW